MKISALFLSKTKNNALSYIIVISYYGFQSLRRSLSNCSAPQYCHGYRRYRSPMRKCEYLIMSSIALSDIDVIGLSGRACFEKEKLSS